MKLVNFVKTIAFVVLQVVCIPLFLIWAIDLWLIYLVGSLERRLGYTSVVTTITETNETVEESGDDDGARMSD